MVQGRPTAATPRKGWGGLRRVAAAALPTLVTAIICLGIFFWYRARTDPLALGKDLNRRAWEATYTERGQAVPPSGPRDGYWGARLGEKVGNPNTEWHEPAVTVPGLLEIDAQGFQRFASPGARQRVVILGGSVAFGCYASSIDRTYFHVLGVALEQAGTPVEIVVVASGAWKAIQEINALNAYGAALAPDLVVFLDGLNDLTNGPTSRTLQGQWVPTLDGSEWTALYHIHDYEQRVADYREIMVLGNQFARRLGSDVLVVLQPALIERERLTRIEEVLLRESLKPYGPLPVLVSSYAAMREWLGQAAREGLFHFLDCSRLLNDERPTTFTDVWHFSDAGHELLGKAMAAAITPILAARARTAAAPPR